MQRSVHLAVLGHPRIKPAREVAEGVEGKQVRRHRGDEGVTAQQHRAVKGAEAGADVEEDDVVKVALLDGVRELPGPMDAPEVAGLAALGRRPRIAHHVFDLGQSRVPGHHVELEALRAHRVKVGVDTRFALHERQEKRHHGLTQGTSESTVVGNRILLVVAINVGCLLLAEHELGGVALRIAIDVQHAQARQCKVVRNVGRQCGLADTALVIKEADGMNAMSHGGVFFFCSGIVEGQVED